MDILERRRGKIKVDPAPEVVKHIIAPGIQADIERSYQTYLAINKAHVMMLAKQNIIEPEVAKSILKVNEEMIAMGDSPKFEISTDREEIYFNLENYLISRLGLEIGGQQHTARSRNDLIATVARMDTRRLVLDLSEKLLELREAVLSLGSRNKDAVMAGYTHLQPSEPITFAHYCSAVGNALERDYERLSAVYQRINRNPLGGTSMGSTTFPIDRDLTARYLGFENTLDNSLDSVCSRDYVMELEAAIAIAGNTISRLAHDLYIWATPDYGYVEVDDSVAVCSSIMPQKKNPWTLEYVKGKVAHLGSSFISSFAALKNTPYTYTQDVSSEAVVDMWRAGKEFTAILELMIATLKGLGLDPIVQDTNYNVIKNKLPITGRPSSPCERFQHNQGM